MKINKVFNNYKELKQKGVAEVVKNNVGEQVLVSKKFDPYTGEVVRANSIRVSKEEVDSQIEELELKVENLKALRKDIK